MDRQLRCVDSIRSTTRTGLGKAAQESPASYIRKQLRLQKQYVAPKQTKQPN